MSGAFISFYFDLADQGSPWRHRKRRIFSENGIAGTVIVIVANNFFSGTDPIAQGQNR